jgi:hypothetical protein
MKIVSIFFLAGLILTAMTQAAAQLKTTDLTGSWETGEQVKKTKIYTEQHFAVATYDMIEKKFISTAGGKWKVNGNAIVETFEFHTEHPDLIGKEVSYATDLKKEKLSLTASGNKEDWKKLDSGEPGKLAGAWLITGRMNNGELSKITPGARRTMKILSGTRFQWIAYNEETKEFLGTGGGTYTTKDGKYTENIEFFSRDNSRVGASLSFDFEIKDGNWHHSGLSSKGDPINEVWTKREKVGI